MKRSLADRIAFLVRSTVITLVRLALSPTLAPLFDPAYDTNHNHRRSKIEIDIRFAERSQSLQCATAASDRAWLRGRGTRRGKKRSLRMPHRLQTHVLHVVQPERVVGGQHDQMSEIWRRGMPTNLFHRQRIMTREIRLV